MQIIVAVNAIIYYKIHFIISKNCPSIVSISTILLFIFYVKLFLRTFIIFYINILKQFIVVPHLF
jgi:hypothetical protein